VAGWVACCLLDPEPLRLARTSWQVDAVDGFGRTALHVAAVRDERDHERPEAASATVGLLLQRGARLDARDCDGTVPLHRAAHGWCLAAMRLLLDRGAEVDARDDQGRTPLTALFACPQERGFVGCSAADGIQLLAGRGADANAVDADGRSPLSHACWHADTDAGTVQALLAAGALVGRDNGPLLIDELLAAAARAAVPPKLGPIDALIGAGAGVSLRNARALAEAAAGYPDVHLPADADAVIEAYPRVLAAAERALDEDEGARVAARLAAAVEADRRDVASGLRALITGAAAEARRLEAARAALAEERRAAAAEREAFARERLAAAAERDAWVQERLAAATERAQQPLEVPNGSGGSEAEPLTTRTRDG
jgi:ankyrin repeat protein